jgi:hypothetical protein
MKLQLIGISTAVTTGYLLFCIRSLLLRCGRHRKISCRAYLLRMMDDEDRPIRSERMCSRTPEIFNPLSRRDYLRPPQPMVNRSGSIRLAVPSNGRKG